MGIIGALMVFAGLCSVWWMVRKKKAVAWLFLRGHAIAVAGLALYAVAPTYAIAARIQRGDLRPSMQVPELVGNVESAPHLMPLIGHPDPVVSLGVRALFAAAPGGELGGPEFAVSEYRVHVDISALSPVEKSDDARKAFLLRALAEVPDWDDDKRGPYRERFSR